LSGPNLNVNSTDGIYITNIRTGHCKMISFQKLLNRAGWVVKNTPVYGFHAKWSSDGQIIMFVIRTLELAVPSTTLGERMKDTITSLYHSITNPNKMHKIKRVRVQHLFVLNRQGSVVRHVISWASRPFLHSVYGQIIHLKDGNHPNWVPGERKITMNLESSELAEGEKKGEWNIVVFDVSSFFEPHLSNVTNTNISRSGGAGKIEQYKARNTNSKQRESQERELLSSPASQIIMSQRTLPLSLPPSLLYPIGTGHPNVHLLYNNRY
jgi:hypothetical protein